MTIITEPGIYSLPPNVYRTQTISLSHSGAKLLLPPSCPAKFKHWLTAGSEHKSEYDFGHAYHTQVLGIGERVEVIEEKNWTKTSAQEARQAAYVTGKVPILRKDADTITKMAEALHSHPHANELLTATGKPEQAIFWVDDITGITRRAMLDFIHDDGAIAVDLKTCVSAEPSAISRAMWANGYYMQAPWYQDAVASCEQWGYWPEFVFIFQEKTPPYLVTVVSPDDEMLAAGHAKNRAAIDLYHQCSTFDHWPGYTDGLVTVGLPRYALREMELEARS
jgi:hypothetical protein